MKSERAAYSRSAVDTAINMVRGTDLTCTRKSEYFAAYMELEKIYNYCSDNINRLLFAPEYELKDFRRASYDYKGYKKSELDDMLRRAKRFLMNELRDISQMMRYGEVDTID